MYHHIRGEVLELTPTGVVVEASGIGFDLHIPLSTYRRLKGLKEASVLTHLYVREDEQRLFGFATPGERDLFRLILSVSGVGPSIALACLCALTPQEVAQSIAAGDIRVLQRVKGVGRKLAERLVLELRDRVGRLLLSLGVEAVPGRPPAIAGTSEAQCSLVPEVSDAVLALVGLGFDRKKAETRAGETYRALGRGKSEVDLETLIKECLRTG